MYGTVAHCRVKPGEFDALVKDMKEWDSKRSPDVQGYVASYVYRLDKDENELILVAVFQDQKTYMANADDPAQDEWYQSFRSHLEADPEWNDGEIVYSV